MNLPPYCPSTMRAPTRSLRKYLVGWLVGIAATFFVFWWEVALPLKEEGLSPRTLTVTSGWTRACTSACRISLPCLKGTGFFREYFLKISFPLPVM